MVSKAVSFAAFLLSISFLPSFVASQDFPTTCHVLDGTANSAAGFRCNNGTTGHSSCCAAGAVCYSNGVCQQSNDGLQDYLRVGCTDSTWQDPACLDQCTTFATDSTAGIRFCNGAITATNQYCCDNGTTGVGSFACCDDQSDIFAINPIASVIAQIPLTASTSSSSTLTSSTSVPSTTGASSAATTTAASGTSSSAVAMTSASSGGSSSNGAAIGAGVGVPLGLIALAGLGFLLSRHRRNSIRKHQAIELRAGGEEYGGQYHDGNNPFSISPYSSYGADSTPMNSNEQKTYFGGRQHENAQQPQELPNTQKTHFGGRQYETVQQLQQLANTQAPALHEMPADNMPRSR